MTRRKQQSGAARPDDGQLRELHVPLSEFALQELEREAERQGLSVSELAAHAVAYYLADAHSGRLSWVAPSLHER